MDMITPEVAEQITAYLSGIAGGGILGFILGIAITRFGGGHKPIPGTERNHGADCGTRWYDVDCSCGKTHRVEKVEW